MVERLLTPEEVAERLGVSPKTVRDYLRAGHIKGVKVGNGRLWRVREADLDAYIQRLGSSDKGHG